MGKNKHKKHHKRDSEGDCSEIRGGKGLKLILKVGGGSTPETLETVSHKKKKKKKDKKRRHHHREKSRTRRPEDEAGSPMEEEEEESETGSVESPLKRLLEYLFPLLQKRDPDNFFGMPVTDAFAPGYSTIIKEPMDFSTMRSKLSSGAYSELEAFKSDFELMCNNALIYNTQGTVYYKAAKRLLSSRAFNPEKLRPLKEHLPFMAELGVKELGFDLEGAETPMETSAAGGAVATTTGSTGGEGTSSSSPEEDKVPPLATTANEGKKAPPQLDEDDDSDELSSEEILAFAKEKAELVAEKVRRKRSELGFLRTNADGTTTLSFLTGGDGVIPGTNNERPVLLGSLIGKVKQGTGAIQGYKEDRNNVAKAVYPLYYGAFSSHGPSYDSTFANLTQEETELVYSTYGDDVGVKYAESIMNFGRDCDYAMFIVDHLLDILTGNEHRKTSKYIEEQKKLRKESELFNKVVSNMDTIDLESLKTLEREAGMELSLLDGVKREIKREESSPRMEVDGEDKSGSVVNSATTPGDLLKKNADLIRELAEVQHERLSSNPPAHYGQMPRPSEKEENLAAQIRHNLAEMAKGVLPGDVVPDDGVKKLLGLPSKAPSPPTNPTPQPCVSID